MILLWLDDTRNPYESFWIKWIEQNVKGSITDYNIIWCKSYYEFITTITSKGLPDVICFDHDLGDTPNDNEKTGYSCAKWLVEYCMDNEVGVPDWYIQSTNPAGKDNINGLLKNFIAKG